jgi:uncharacterized membrane protein (DUF485 family)
MTHNVSRRLAADPKFKDLAVRRGRFSLLLSMGVLGSYYTFMMVVAFWPSLLATPLTAGSITPIGVPIGVAIIVSSWLLTGLYVYRANTEFDAITVDLLQEVS